MIILITGTRKGIGLELTKNFLQRGDTVIGCSRGKSDLHSENYTHFEADVANEDDVAKVFSFIRKNFNRLDALINNAGIASMNHSLLTPINTVRNVFETNAVGTFLFCRESAKIMKKNHSGRIVNFSTVAVPLKLDGESVYAASKAAIISITQTLAREYAEFGITVNAIGPTPVETDLIRNVPKEKIDRLLDRQAIRRFGTVDDIQNVIDFFLKQESNFITGQIVYLGGI